MQQEANFRGNAAQIPITHVLSILTTSSEMPSQMPIVTDNLPFERFCVDCEWEGFDSHCEHEYHGGEIIEVCPLCRGFVADTKHAKQAIQAGATFDNQIPF